MLQSCKGLADCHTHTCYSFDSEADPAEMLARADELELSAYCVTDHCEMNSTDLTSLERDMKASVRAVEQLRSSRFQDSATHFLTGLELGQGLQNRTEAERFLREIPVDFVIGSLHNLAGEEDFYYLSYTEETAAAYLERYFDELLEMAEWGGFDSLGHLTYPLRYITGKYHIRPDMMRYRHKVDAVLSALAKGDRALEVNTSGLRNEIGETLPTMEYLVRFRELGGKHITIGSDAHEAQHVGAGLEQAAKMIKKAGFPGITCYIGHKPFLIPFDK